MSRPKAELHLSSPDRHIQLIFSSFLSLPVGSESSRSRLRNVATLRLSGLDVSESTLRLLQRHMPQLERLDLAHCKDITDASIALLAAAGTHTRNNLTELTLAGQWLSTVTLPRG